MGWPKSTDKYRPFHVDEEGNLNNKDWEVR